AHPWREPTDELLACQHGVQVGTMLRRADRMREAGEAVVQVSHQTVGVEAPDPQPGAEPLLELPERGPEPGEDHPPVHSLRLPLHEYRGRSGVDIAGRQVGDGERV